MRTVGVLVGTSHFHDFGRYMHMTTYSPSEEDEEDEDDLIALECVVGKNWVITAHDRPIPVLEEFSDRVSGSGDTGVLDGPAFLATLLEWVLGAYSQAFSGWRSAWRSSTCKQCGAKAGRNTVLNG